MLAAALAAAGVSAVISLSVTRTAGQGQTTRPARTVDNRPNFSGIWQANNEAHWDLQAHAARAGMVMQDGVYPYPHAQVPAAQVVALGAAAGVPGSIGVVQGDGEIPYTSEAAAIRKENSEHWIDRDPELKCYLPGIPRVMYMPYPFQIVQSTNKIHMAYAFTSPARTIHLDDVAGPPDDTYMGHLVGRWEGDTLVVQHGCLESRFLEQSSTCCFAWRFSGFDVARRKFVADRLHSRTILLDEHQRATRRHSNTGDVIQRVDRVVRI